MADKSSLGLLAVWRARFFLAGLVGVTTFFIGWFWWYQPLWRQTIQTRAAVQQSESMVRDLQDLLATRKTAQAFLASVSEEGREKLLELVPHQLDLPLVVKSIDAMVSAVGGSVEAVDVNDGGVVAGNAGETVKAGQPPALVGADQLMIQLRLQSMDYVRLKQLLSSLESHVPLLLVDSFVISDRTPGLELSLHWFYFP